MRNNFLHGLVFGSGFALSVVAIAAAALFWIPWGKAAAEQSDVAFQEFTAPGRSVEDLKVVTQSKVRRGDDVIVLGRIKNDGKTTATSYALEVELFDQGGQFVDLCRESYFGGIKAGEERHFKVSCGGCSDKPVPEHATYKIRVTE
jgi:hypothetical protein